MPRTLITLTFLAVLAVSPEQAKANCASEPLCPDGHVPTGEFPQCRCTGEPPPPPLPEPPPEPVPPSEAEPPPEPPHPPVEPEPNPDPEPGPFDPLPALVTCQTHFACPDPRQTAFGQFPDCTCADLDTPLPPGSPTVPDPGIPPGMGSEADTCELFFSCPEKFKVGVQAGRCICEHEMLPEDEEQ